ncbi:SphA family protein [Vineibacter terrae]|uniref:SphA family protein n=1 Tax=Vineibacter terrae TaxID=2586908 RepID=UPI002E323701|nr:transporter [Vineibacter terrae]HEX2888027.1 transporter [Vineibacter terrae]
MKNPRFDKSSSHAGSPWRCLGFTRIRRLAAAAVAAIAMSGGGAQAAENGAGFYLLGNKGPGAGVLPPPGVFFQNDFYFYDGHFGGSKGLPLNGNVVAGVKAQLYGDFLTFLAVAPWDVAGGNLGFTIVIPVGGPNITALASVIGPRGNEFSRSVSDSTFTIGDLVFGPMLGWHAGKFHWNVAALINAPSGDYHPGQIANLAFHRWGADFTGSLTWLDPELGLDLSMAIGITVNGKNPVTNYKTGTEFHLEWAVSKNIGKQFSVGLLGYHYQQLSNDSGSGARLGGFKGRVTAVGATMAYNMLIASHPVSARIKFFSEFNTQNRPEGQAVFLTLSTPITMFGAE